MTEYINQGYEFTPHYHDGLHVIAVMYRGHEIGLAVSWRENIAWSKACQECRYHKAGKLK